MCHHNTRRFIMTYRAILLLSLIGLALVSVQAQPQVPQPVPDSRPAYNQIFQLARQKKQTRTARSQPKTEALPTAGKPSPPPVSAAQTAIASEAPSNPKSSARLPLKDTSESASSASPTNKPPNSEPETSFSAGANSEWSNTDTHLLGVTLWLFREPVAPVEQRIISQKGKLIAERASIDKALSQKDLARLSFEIPSVDDAYLYIIDREINADGSLSEPYLIFPLTTTRGGDNRISAGQIVNIPSPQDAIPYFSVLNAGPNLRGEMLTIIVSPTKLQEIPLTDQITTIKKELFQEWEKKWKTTASRLEDQAQIGKLWTEEERKAMEDNHSLTQHDPLPLTIFKVRPNPGQPYLVTFPIHYR